MAQGDLYKLVSPLFANSFKKCGYRHIKEEFFAQTFGSENLIYESNEVRLRFLSERGDLNCVSVIIGPLKSTNQHLLHTILKYLDFAPQAVYEPPLAEMARIFDTACLDIENFFGSGEYMRSLNELKIFEQKCLDGVLDEEKRKLREKDG